MAVTINEVEAAVKMAVVGLETDVPLVIILVMF